MSGDVWFCARSGCSFQSDEPIDRCPLCGNVSVVHIGFGIEPGKIRVKGRIAISETDSEEPAPEPPKRPQLRVVK